jgi:hypothetical protein
MSGLRQNAIGILPAGALGVSLFHHLTRGSTQLEGDVVFLERPGSHSSEAFRAGGVIRIQTDAGMKTLPCDKLMFPSPTTCFTDGLLPEILLVCTNPDQLLGIVTHCVQLLEAIANAGALSSSSLPFPAVVLCSNGIYHQRIRQLFVEKLEEATLYGRLPDLWPDLMPLIVGRWLRGVSIQTGVRDGSGTEAVYLPGPSGITRVAGGLPTVRERVVQQCGSRGAWFEDAGDRSPTRIEFDKAIVNLAGNLIGLLQAIDERGGFKRLHLDEIATPANRSRIDRLAAEVFRVGQAVRAYGPGDRLADQIDRLHRTLDLHRDHVPSSIQWVDVELRRRRLAAKLTPTEKWLLEPLIRYARAAGLEETAEYFKALERELIRKLQTAAERSKEI